MDETAYPDVDDDETLPPIITGDLQDTWLREEISCPVLVEYLPYRILINDIESTGRYSPSPYEKNIEPEMRYSHKGGVGVPKSIFAPRLYIPYSHIPIFNNSKETYRGIQNHVGIKGMIELCNQRLAMLNQWWYPSTVYRGETTTRDLKTVSRCYSNEHAQLKPNYPLHFHIPMSRKELHGINKDDLHSIMYTGDHTDFTRHPGICGRIHDCSIVDVSTLFTNAAGEVSQEPSDRHTRANWSMFIDCIYTPTSTDAGSMRSLVNGVRYRCCTKYTHRCVLQLLNLARVVNKSKSEYVILHYCHIVDRITLESADNIMRAWMLQNGRNAPSLHYFRDEGVISILASPGCLMRPNVVPRILTQEVEHIKWYDSLIMHDSAMMSLYGIGRVDASMVPQYMRTLGLLVPYGCCNEPPRLLISSPLLYQAVSRPFVELNSTIRACATYPPLCRTPILFHIYSRIKDTEVIDFPGVNVICLYTNLPGNYEDSVIVSRGASTKLAHEGYVIHPVPPGVETLKEGQTIETSTTWWRPSVPGTVVGEGVSRAKRRYVRASIGPHPVTVGDKLATWHGQKFTVSSVVPNSQMPLCTDCRSGRMFRPDVLIACASVHNRATIGQVVESCVTLDLILQNSAVKDVPAEPGVVPQFQEGYTYDTEIECAEASGVYVTAEHTCDGALLSKSHTCTYELGPSTPTVCDVVTGTGTKIKCDYGCCRLLLTSHLVRDKQHYMNEIPRGLGQRRGRLNGSSVRIGEMEIQAMLMAGYVRCLHEILESSDMCVVSICSGCRRLVILCDCSSGMENNVVEIVTRTSLVKVDILGAIYTLNSYTGSIVSSNTFSPSYVPRSFVYNTD